MVADIAFQKRRELAQRLTYHSSGCIFPRLMPTLYCPKYCFELQIPAAQPFQLALNACLCFIHISSPKLSGA